MFVLSVLSAVFAIVNGHLVSGTSEVSPRIFNGTHAKPGQFPSVVKIEEKGRDDCGGHILNERWVLTAAHCYHGIVTDLQVYAGVTKVSEKGKSLEVEKVISYPHVDLALVKLKKSLTWSTRVKPLVKFARVKMNEKVTAVGYGFGSSDHLSWLEAKTRPCSHDDEKTLCVESAYGKVCHGDSGSPLFNKNGDLVGILSRGMTSKVVPFCGDVVFYIRPDAYVDWIKEVTNIQNISVS